MPFMRFRIKYKKTKRDGVLKSSIILTSQTTGAKYEVYIDKNEVTYKIVNLSGRGNFYGGEGINSLEVLGRHIRRKLRSLGIGIKNETRMISTSKDETKPN